MNVHKKKKTALIREALSWPRKTEQNIIANFATKFGSGRVILFPLLANPETEPELCVISLSHNEMIILLHSFSKL